MNAGSGSHVAGRSPRDRWAVLAVALAALASVTLASAAELARAHAAPHGGQAVAAVTQPPADPKKGPGPGARL